MIQPSALNALIVLAMVIVTVFIWRQIAAHYSEHGIGQAMAAVL